MFLSQSKNVFPWYKAHISDNTKIWFKIVDLQIVSMFDNIKIFIFKIFLEYLRLF